MKIKQYPSNVNGKEEIITRGEKPKKEPKIDPDLIPVNEEKK